MTDENPHTSLPKPGAESDVEGNHLPLVGIIGGGQLARMMAQAAIGLGLPLRILAEGQGVSAAQVVPDTQVGDYTDAAAVLEFAASCDVVTFDHEHVPTELLQQLEQTQVAVRPSSQALVHAQDKAAMRTRLAAMGVPCPEWGIVRNAEEIRSWGDAHGWPVIVKTARGGYDGHGVWKIDSADGSCAAPFRAAADVEIICEEFVDFARELSAIVVRNPRGDVVAYPISETRQSDGICVETITPAPDLDADQQTTLQHIATRIATELGVVGVLAVELMQRRDGSVVVNELAMRPHNTGHWTIDGATTSQFENHLRAVAALPLGATTLHAPWTVMHNILGGEIDGWPNTLTKVFGDDPGVKLHWYGKGWRQGRKLGHVTCIGDDLAHVRSRAARAAALLRGEL